MAARTHHPQQPCSDAVLENGIRLGLLQRVTPLEETYHVLGDRGITYTVTVTDHGRKAVCDPACPARRRGLVCKHIAAVADYRMRHGAPGRPAAA